MTLRTSAFAFSGQREESFGRIMLMSASCYLGLAPANPHFITDKFYFMTDKFHFMTEPTTAGVGSVIK
jgi:hypothetical protein